MYLLKEEESYILAASEIDGAHGLPRDIQTFTDKLQQVVHGIGGQITSNFIKPASSQIYPHKLIQCVNINKEGAEGHKRRTRTGMIKVLGLIHKKAKQRDPRLTWFMFHHIYRMYSDIKKK